MISRIVRTLITAVRMGEVEDRHGDLVSDDL